MPNKRKPEKEQQAKTSVAEAAISETPAAEDELEQLRNLVFGAARQKLVTQITSMHNELKQALSTQEQSFCDRISKLQQNIEQQFSQMDKKIQLLDKAHNNTEADLQKSLTGLASEHETFAATTEHDFKEMDKSLNNESTLLANSFNEKLEQLNAHLEEVSKELSSSKTDRKTLAKLLATMATNLEDDQL
ncbi:hypothetical protein [Thalassomonas actiniarum]|uniref:Uncharacterized protein n=1 Tax=Thalassomonas actiniarum TaxID=485447 RepID=A0AAE9YL68_9GAMM|nr:hypothetical protein [Thalassomonas actiniarum]WDD96763.1 hypothetical protein SG35_015405 [Thalassomonas actiniarum]